MNKEHIFFTTIREDFNEYDVENGQTLRMKIILSDLFVVVNKDGTKSTQAGFKEVSLVFANKEIDTSNLQLSSPEKVTEQDEIKTLGFQTIKEVVNIYETQHLLMLLYPRVTNISLTDKKSAEGEPILRYHTSVTFNNINKGSLMPITQPVSKS